MKSADVLLLVGKPYEPFGRGPDTFNCWGLLRFVQLNYFGKDMGEMPIGAEAETRQQHVDNLEVGLYQPITYPMHGDAVLMRGGDCPHVGVWLEIDGGGVLHSLEDIGVIWTPKGNLNRLGFGRRTYYRISDASKFSSTERPVSAVNQT